MNSEDTLTIMQKFREHAETMRRPVTILIVDDEWEDILLIQHMISKLQLGSVSCEVAGDGVRAMELLEAKPFDLVLLDIKMPRMDGVEVMRRVKSEGIKTRVVLMTGLTNGPLVTESLKLGAVFHLLKPVTIENLKQVLSLIHV